MGGEAPQQGGCPGDIGSGEQEEGLIRLGKLAPRPLGETVDGQGPATATTIADETHPPIDHGELLHDGFAAIGRSIRSDEEPQLSARIV